LYCELSVKGLEFLQGGCEVEGLHEQFIVDKSGKKMAVILPIEDYEELLEDIHDLAVIAERKDEPATGFEEIKKRLKADGLI